jgi:RNA polymerase sigma-70 factor (ECF subfamily)
MDVIRGGSDLDEALEAARDGSARGFDTLFRALSGSVTAYLRARNVDDAEDLANEVFLRAFRTLSTFRGDADRFRSWLFTIAHHAAIDDRRRFARRITQVPLGVDHASPGGDVEEEVFAGLADDRVRGLLDQLSPDQRDVLLLRIVADLTAEQTAATLDKSYEAVKALQRRGLASLRRRLGEAATPRGQGVPG